jgi:hypothetical protein
MVLTNAKKVVAVVMIAVGLIHVVGVISPADAAWRERSDELPGMEDSSDAIAGGVVAALAVAAVLGVVYAIVKWNKKPLRAAEVSQVRSNDTAGLAALRGLKGTPNPTRRGITDGVVVTGLSVSFR